MADTLIDYIKQHLLTAGAVQRLDRSDRPKSPEIKNETRLFRFALRRAGYHFRGKAGNDELAVTPLVGLGKQSVLNKTIHHLMSCADQKLTLCTPISTCRRCWCATSFICCAGKQVEIIVGDKTANDFYIPEDQPFKIIGALPYLYEINLRRFLPLAALRRHRPADRAPVERWR